MLMQRTGLPARVCYVVRWLLHSG